MVKSTLKSASLARATGAVLNLAEETTIRVLHVDDEIAFLKAAKQCLELEEHFEVEFASSAEEALEKLRRENFDVIISDFVMPEKDGLQLLRAVRSGGSNVPFIVFTGKGREEVAIEALNLGADRYLSKTGAPSTVYGELVYSIHQLVDGRKAEEALRLSEEKYRRLVHHSLQGFVVVQDYQIVFANEAVAQICGFTVDELLSLPPESVKSLVHPDDQPLVWGRLKARLAGKNVPSRYEFRGLQKSGDEIWMEMYATRIDYGGKPAIQASIIDVTERKKAEKALHEKEHLIRESQQKFESLFKHNPEATVHVDWNFRVLDANPRFEQLFKYKLEEIRGKKLLDLIVPKDKSNEGRMLDERAREGQVHYNTVRRRRDGSLIQVSISAAPIFVEGQLLGYMGVYKDIGKRAAEKIRFEERLSALNKHGQSLNMAMSLEEIYALTLTAMERTLGFEHAAFMIVDNNILHVADQRGYPESLSIKLQLTRSEKGVTAMTARTGRSVYVPDTGKEETYVEGMPDIQSELAVPVKIGDTILGVLNVENRKLDAFDEKDQMLLEILSSHAATAMTNLQYARDLEKYVQEARESQERFKGLFMGNPEATVYMDANFHVLEVNPRFERLFGYSASEVRSKHINDLIVPGDLKAEGEALDGKARKGYVYHDTVRKRKDGLLTSVSVSAAPITVENRSLGYVATYTDISKLKNTEVELKETMKKLETVNEKLSVVGKLVRHDARNKLSIITMDTFLAKKKLGNHEALEHLFEIELAVNQTERIFDFARAYEQLGLEELVYIDVETSFKEAFALVSNSHGLGITIECSGLAVLADSLLVRVFYNLLDNTVKYGETASQVKLYSKISEEDQLRLIYEDNGTGLNKTEKKRVFSEGYGKGTGYGLYLIRKIIDVYGWSIQETGETGKGAQFTMTIPAVNRKGKESYRSPTPL